MASGSTTSTSFQNPANTVACGEMNEGGNDKSDNTEGNQLSRLVFIFRQRNMFDVR
jgi:hypothetical protein